MPTFYRASRPTYFLVWDKKKLSMRQKINQKVWENQEKVWKIDLSMRKSMRFLKKYGEKYEVKTKFATKIWKSLRFCPKSMRIWLKKPKTVQKAEKYEI